MSDIKLFRTNNGTVEELKGSSVDIEKTLQALIEQHLEAILGIRFLATEYSTGKTHQGRIDTLGIDENGSPVIIEYKRAINENVINQGLFYLDWLMDHKAEFELLVLKKLGHEQSETIEWNVPRLLCIASDFTKYDEHAVQQINRNIELMRYKRYSSEFLLLELVNATTAQPATGQKTAELTRKNEFPSNSGQINNREKSKTRSGEKAVTAFELLEQASPDLKDLFESMTAFLLALGDDVQMKTLQTYFAFRRIQNFACITVYPHRKYILAYIKVDPTTIHLEEGFTRDIRTIGHHGTGDLEVTIRTAEDFERAKNLLLKSYEGS